MVLVYDAKGHCLTKNVILEMFLNDKQPEKKEVGW